MRQVFVLSLCLVSLAAVLACYDKEAIDHTSLEEISGDSFPVDLPEDDSQMMMRTSGKSETFLASRLAEIHFACFQVLHCATTDVANIALLFMEQVEATAPLGNAIAIAKSL
jgi:hypothetical protein